jgi:hypothetical protein
MTTPNEYTQHVHPTQRHREKHENAEEEQYEWFFGG